LSGLIDAGALALIGGCSSRSNALWPYAEHWRRRWAFEHQLAHARLCPGLPDGRSRGGGPRARGAQRSTQARRHRGRRQARP